MELEKELDRILDLAGKTQLNLSSEAARDYLINQIIETVKKTFV